jgi:hypothetical protein
MVVRANAGAATLQHGAQLLHFIFSCAECPVDESSPVSTPWFPASDVAGLQARMHGLRGSRHASRARRSPTASRGEWCPGPHPPMVTAASPFRGTAAAMNQIRRRRTTPDIPGTLPQRIEKDQPARQSMDRMPTQCAQEPYRFVMSSAAPATLPAAEDVNRCRPPCEPAAHAPGFPHRLVRTRTCSPRPRPSPRVQ